RQRAGPAIEFPRLSHAAHRPGTEDRGARHQERRGARRHRRDRRDGGTAGIAQRDLRRDRRRLAAAADRPQPDRGEEIMSTVTRRILLSVAVIVLVALAAGIWIVRGPDPMASSGGPKVALSDYKAGNPTGVPASLANASLVDRGKYLAEAADCMACHTSQGGKDYTGGLGIRLPFGT